MTVLSSPSVGSFRAPVLVALTAALSLAACSAASTPSPSGPPIVVPPQGSPAATAPATAEPSTAEESPSAAPSVATAVPTAIDPCQLLSPAEASQFAGATYTAGEESETPGHLRICTYGAQTKNVFEVQVLQAPDVATAQKAAAAAEAQAKAELPTGKIGDVSGIGDKAVIVQSETSTPLGASGIYVLVG